MSGASSQGTPAHTVPNGLQQMEQSSHVVFLFLVYIIYIIHDYDDDGDDNDDDDNNHLFL